MVSTLHHIKSDVFVRRTRDEEMDVSIYDKVSVEIIFSNITVIEKRNLELPLPFKAKALLSQNKRSVYMRTKGTLAKMEMKRAVAVQCTNINWIADKLSC